MNTEQSSISVKSDATFSPCRQYRYSLRRQWGDPAGGYAMFVGLNPSTADETMDDQTIRRCVGFAKQWGVCRSLHDEPVCLSRDPTR